MKLAIYIPVCRRQKCMELYLHCTKRLNAVVLNQGQGQFQVCNKLRVHRWVPGLNSHCLYAGFKHVVCPWDKVQVRVFLYLFSIHFLFVTPLVCGNFCYVMRIRSKFNFSRFFIQKRKILLFFSPHIRTVHLDIINVLFIHQPMPQRVVLKNNIKIYIKMQINVNFNVNFNIVFFKATHWCISW